MEMMKITDHEEIIKPETPIASHLQTYRLSLLDQLDGSIYAPHLIYFYPATTETTKSQIKSNLSQLKKSLSKTLSVFHPLAGRLSEDGLSVNCNDDGAAYVEAEVTDVSVEELVSKPKANLFRQLVPQQDPFALSGRVLTVQVTVFRCGGVAITIGALHAIVDGTTSFSFKNAWAANARGSSEHIVPSFVPTTSFFPPNPLLPKDCFLWVDSLIEPVNSNCVTRRFLFDSSALSSLRQKASSEMFVQRPSRFEAVTALVWGRAIEALRKANGVKRPSVFSTAVDLRRRMVPPLPTEAFGNLIWPAIALCKAEDSVELQRLVGLIREATKKIDAKFIDKIKNNFDEAYQELCASYATNEGVGNTDFFSSSSLVNMGMYELDFGFGKPKWVGYGIIDSPQLRNSFYCMETKSGDEIEVWVTLKQEDMAMLEKDAELLMFSSIDPCPF